MAVTRTATVTYSGALADGEGTVTAGSSGLFADLPVAARVTVNLTAAEQQYRYRLFDEVIPIRNMLLANN